MIYPVSKNIEGCDTRSRHRQPSAANAGLIEEAWHGSPIAGPVLIKAVVQQQNGEDVVWIGRF